MSVVRSDTMPCYCGAAERERERERERESVCVCRQIELSHPRISLAKSMA